jgi:tetratricopeptide (TPR) repeat protein
LAAVDSRDGAGAVQVTQRLTSPDFVGRERELAGLVAGLERAADGRPAVALVAVALLPDDGDPAGRARVLGAEGHLLMLLGRGVEALDRCEGALDMARAAGARREEGSILATMCAALTNAGDAEAGIAAGREALRIAEERGDVEEIARAYVNLGETLDWAGRLAEAAETARVGTAEVLEQGIGSVAGLLASDHGVRLLRLGRWDEADAVLSAGLDAVPAAGISAGAALCVRSMLDLLRGHFQEAAECVEEAERAQEHAIGSMWTGPIAAARAELALWRGATAEGRDVIIRLLDGLDPSDQDAFYL